MGLVEAATVVVVLAFVTVRPVPPLLPKWTSVWAKVAVMVCDPVPT